jgi:hypothetical protein
MRGGMRATFGSELQSSAACRSLGWYWLRPICTTSVSKPSAEYWIVSV